MTRFWDGRTDGQTDGVIRLLDLLSPLATQVIKHLNRLSHVIVIKVFRFRLKAALLFYCFSPYYDSFFSYQLSLANFSKNGSNNSNELFIKI